MSRCLTAGSLTFADIYRVEKREQYKGKTGPKILLQLENVVSCIQANFVFLNKHRALTSRLQAHPVSTRNKLNLSKDTLVSRYFTSSSGIHNFKESLVLSKVPFTDVLSLASAAMSTLRGTFLFWCPLSHTFCCLP